MSFDEVLIHTCRIRRPATTGTEDDRGGTTPDTPTLIGEAVPCRFVAKERKLITSNAAAGGVEMEYKLFFTIDQDIAEDDLIDTIVLGGGMPALPGSFRVWMLFPRTTNVGHHTQTRLEKIA